MTVTYGDRREAGRLLGKLLLEHRGEPSLLVLGLPRGGVPVAYEVAQALGAPLDVLVVRKIGVPFQPELAMGAIASGDVVVMNDSVLAMTGLGEAEIDDAVERARHELHEREERYRAGRRAATVSGKRLILVDDGLATGSTMRAAVASLRRLEPERIIVAVPVAPPDTVELLRGEVDEVICPSTPLFFGSVGSWYESFPQTSDEEVRALLAAAPQPQAAAHP